MNAPRLVTLRDYQAEAIDQVRRLIKLGKRRILLCVPTGGGKTLTSCSMLEGVIAKGNRAAFVAHRLELIDQTVQTFGRIGITDVGVVRAKDPRLNEDAPIQVCSIQTLQRRAHLRDIAVVIIDEAHRSLAKSYIKHLFDAYPDAVFVGLTATPCRGDGKPLSDHWQELVIGARYSQLIDEHHIEAPLVYSTPVVADLSQVRTSGGDYNLEDLEAAVNRSALIGNIVAEWQKRAEGRRSVIFAVSVAHSKAIVEDFLKAGVRAEHLDGNTPEVDRRAILARLESHATQLVSNVGVLCEGWDQPSVKYLAIARPTKSLSLWMQMAGRGLRPFQGIAPIILDHGGNVDRMAERYGGSGLPHEDRTWSLTDKVPRAGKSATKVCPECFAYIPQSARNCPHCAHQFGHGDLIAEPKEIEQLPHVELELRTLDGDDAQLSFYRATSKKAQERGWKFGAVYHRFVERFGIEPPKEWTEALRRAWKADDSWRERVKARPPLEGPIRPEELR